MATMAGYGWSSSLSLALSPDEQSPVHPGRPIRPLPQRSIRSKLSPEQAQSIRYPPAPLGSNSLFNVPYSDEDLREPRTSDSYRAGRHLGAQRGERSGHRICGCGAEHSDLESEDDFEQAGAPQRHSFLTKSLERNNRHGYQRNSRSSVTKPTMLPSASSSVDGYESFENTNNKKKRKIPVSGSAGAHHSTLSPEMASIGISSNMDEGATDPLNGPGQIYTSNSPSSTPTSGVGISGAGRGRFGRTPGRNANERRPLGSSTNGVNAYANGTTNKSRREWQSTSAAIIKGVGSEQGIISAAIASAAEQGPVTPLRDKENVGVLRQQGSESPPQKAQFTFTCESDSSNKMLLPSMQPYKFPLSSPSATNLRQQAAAPLPPLPTSSRWTQTAAQMAGLPGNQPLRAGDIAIPQSQTPLPPQQAPPKKTRPRRPGREYALAARQRRLNKEYENYNKPPSREEIWICEFCEYESIFGRPPEALVRQYEIKDRQEKRRAAEKKRLLEKARMKGRKGKKGTKAPHKNLPGRDPMNQPQPRYDQPLESFPLPQHDQQGDEFFDDDYDDEPLPEPVPAPHPHYKPDGIYAGGGQSKN